MGQTPSSIKFEECPVPVLTFGPNTDIHQGQNWVQLYSEVNQFFRYYNTPQSYVDSKEIICAVSPLLKKVLDQVESTYNKLKEIEPKLFSVILESTVSVLKGNAEDLEAISSTEDPQTFLQERIENVGTSLSLFLKILPIFTTEESIVFQKVWIGAQLFIKVWIALRLVSRIAEIEPQYYQPGLEFVRGGYEEWVDFYKCCVIRMRLHSVCLLEYTNLISKNPVPFYHRFVEDMETDFPKYFGCEHDHDCIEQIVLNHTRNYNVNTCPMLLDGWDPRPTEELTFEVVTLAPEEGVKVDQYNLYRKVVKEYRKKVVALLEAFFDGPEIKE